MARVLFLVGEDFEDSEFERPKEALERAGHEVVIAGAKKGTLEGKKKKVKAELTVAAKDVAANDFDALVIPGGYGPDHLRLDEASVALTRHLFHAGKLIAAICHGPQLLIEADVVRGRKLTSWPSVRKDLENAGARWRDAEVVVDETLVTSRKPDDLDAFCAAILKQLAGDKNARRAPWGGLQTTIRH